MKGLNELIISGWILFGILLTPLIFGVMDFNSGVRKAKLRGEKITSDGWRRSVKKIGEYYRLLFALVVVDCMHIGCSWYLNTFFDYHIPTFPFITFIGAIVVAAIEIRSIREKAEDKVKKQMNDVASLAIEIAKHKADPAEIAEAVVNYMNQGTIKQETK